MSGDERIFVDASLVDPRDAGLDVKSLLRTNYIYTTINTTDRRPLFLKEHLHYAAASYEALYGERPTLTAADIAKRISDLLYYGFYPEGGNTVDIYLLPRPEQPLTLIIHNSATVENGYALSPHKLLSTVANYEIPFEHHKTAASLTAAGFADDFARRNGADVALRANRAGTVISSGDSPFFAVRNDVLYTPAVDHGARASVERDLLLRLCRYASVKVVEEDIAVADLADYDELAIFSPTGLHTIARIDEIYYLNVMAHKLEKQLERLTAEGTKQSI
ncbi:MAG: aminotransferase class IV [Tidjanibacter sp.]|nr:aminotransferase class IV [Tidjanibacter sp.]